MIYLLIWVSKTLLWHINILHVFLCFNLNSLGLTECHYLYAATSFHRSINGLLIQSIKSFLCDWCWIVLLSLDILLKQERYSSSWSLHERRDLTLKKKTHKWENNINSTSLKNWQANKKWSRVQSKNTILNRKIRIRFIGRVIFK